MFVGYLLEVWNKDNEKVLEQNFENDLETAVGKAGRLAGVMTKGKGTVVIVKRYFNDSTHEIEDTDVMEL